MGLKDLSELLFPSGIRCIVCGAELSTEKEFCVCDKCVLPFTEKFCLKCGRKIANMADYCEPCKNYPVSFDKARSSLVFDGEVKQLIYRFKYGSEKYLAHYFAEMLYKTYVKENLQVDFITFVPLHIKRERKRGYNQAELLANELSALTNIPVKPLLLKDKHTKNMAKLNAAKRRQLIKGTFSFAGEPSEIRRKKILLIDDVLTTGSTANECADTLKKGKPESVFVLTIASLPVKPDLKKSKRLKDIKLRL